MLATIGRRTWRRRAAAIADRHDAVPRVQRRVDEPEAFWWPFSGMVDRRCAASPMVDRGWGWSIALELLGFLIAFWLWRTARSPSGNRRRFVSSGLLVSAARHEHQTSLVLALCDSLTACSSSFVTVARRPTPPGCCRGVSTRISTRSVSVKRWRSAKMIGPVDEVISSPLRRARATAEAFGLPVEIDERWIELATASTRASRSAGVQRGVAALATTIQRLRPRAASRCVELNTRVRAARSASSPTWLAIVTSWWSPTSPRSRPPWHGCSTPTFDFAFRSHLSHAAICRVEFRPIGPILYSWNETAPNDP